MNTFLPYPSFEESARVIDDKRLGKQRVEVLQILNALLNPDAKGWVNHPCTNMWRGFERALAAYGIAVCNEWIGRGFKDTVAGKLADRVAGLPDTGGPSWIGDERVHSGMRANLIRKDPEHYGRFGWKENGDEPYYWPPSRRKGF